MNVNKKKLIVSIALIMSLFATAGSAIADSIYVIKQDNHGMISNAITQLTGIGHTVTSSSLTLSDYSMYDQVWDLRYYSAISADDTTAFTTYMKGGGNMYLTGEWSTAFDTRNNSLETFVNGLGAGSLNFTNAVAGMQRITTAGQVVNSPNDFSEISFNYASLGTGASVTNGFLVTEYDNTGTGSLIGWDFNDISAAVNARMLVGLDIEIFANGEKWTENMASYLSGNPTPTPIPAAIWLFGAGFAGIAGLRRKKKNIA